MILTRYHALHDMTEEGLLGPLTTEECRSLIVTADQCLRERNDIRRALHSLIGEDKALHHIDGDPHNNKPENLEVIWVEGQQ